MMGVGLDYRKGLRGAVERQGGLGQAGMAPLPPSAPLPQPAGGGGAAGGLGGLPSPDSLRSAYKGGQQARAGIGQAADWVGRQFQAPMEGVLGTEALGPPVPPDLGVPVAQVVDDGARTPRFARGGLAPIRGPRRATSKAPSGLIHSASPGRADLVAARVRRGAYIVPADVVSGLGQGNTLAGAKMLHSSLPEAVDMASAGPIDRAMGGRVEDDSMEVRLSGGEYQIAPEQVLAIGGGDVKAGAATLDRLVAAVRAEAQQHLATTPPPK
jgi:hypothetical protein